METTPKPLTLLQFDESKERALKRVQKRIGDKPTRAKFQREYSPLWTLADSILTVVFACAFGISILHVFAHMGMQASASFSSMTTWVYGLQLEPNFNSTAQQILYLGLAEFGLLGFLLATGMTDSRWKKAAFYGAGILLAMFIFLANWQSGIGTLESVIVPVVSVLLGIHFEQKLAELLKRRADIDQRYNDALNTYEAAIADPTTYPDYMPLLRQELWGKLVSLKANAEFIDAEAPIKLAAVERELERDRWAFDKPMPAHKNGRARSPLELVDRKNGSGA